MKRFIEVAVALAMILGAGAARAQNFGPQTAELAPTVVSAPVHRTMAPPQFAIPVARPPVVHQAQVVAVNPAPSTPVPDQPVPIMTPPSEVPAADVAPSSITMANPNQALTMAPNVSPLPLPPSAPPSLAAPTPLPDSIAAAAIPASAVASAPMPIVVAPPAAYMAAAPVPLPMSQTAVAGSTPVTLEAGTGELLRLPVAAATIMSAQPTIARVQPASPTSMFVMGVGPGRTTVIAARADGTAIAQYDVMVTPGMSATLATPGGAARPEKPTTVTPAMADAAQAAINQSVPGAQEVHARAGGMALILTGTVATAQMAQSAVSIGQGYIGPTFKVEDQLTVLGSIQVNVRVRIAEISRTITRQLGFNWQAFGSTGLGNGAFQLGSLVAPIANLASATPFTGGTPSNHWDINGVIDALAQDNLITILAEPNLTAQSGETASFLAGGEFPIPISAQTSNGAPTVTIAFKQFGVSLALVPTVLSPNRLNLRIRPEVSQLSNQGAVSIPVGSGTLTIPALSVRRAETTIELGSGQSFAIAGLLQKTTTNETSALPGLGELPILGALFKSNAFQRGESELVIIVTPYIVRPVSSPTALRSPTDHYHPATDLGRILFGRQMATAPANMPALDAGFILK